MYCTEVLAAMQELGLPRSRSLEPTRDRLNSIAAKEAEQKALETRREQQQQQKEAATAAELRLMGQGSGVKMLKQAMARLAKGELGYLVMLWKAGQKAAAVQAALDVQNGLKQGAGLKMLQRAFAELTKGELGLRLMLWRTGKQEAKEAAKQAEQDALAAAMEAELNSKAQGAGLRMLKQTLAEATRGELGLRLQIWYLQTKDDLKINRDAEQDAMAAAMEAELKSKEQGAGLRMLKQTLAEMAKGELGLRVMLWRAGKDQSLRDAQDALTAAMSIALRSGENKAGLQMIKQVVADQIKGEKGMRLRIWRGNQLGQWQDGLVAAEEERQKDFAVAAQEVADAKAVNAELRALEDELREELKTACRQRAEMDVAREKALMDLVEVLPYVTDSFVWSVQAVICTLTICMCAGTTSSSRQNRID